MQKLLTFFSAKILAYMSNLMIKVLTIRYLTTSLVLNNWAQYARVKSLDSEQLAHLQSYQC